MQDSQIQLLALVYIAKLWADELLRMGIEEHADTLLTRMRLALMEGKLSPADPADVSKIEFYKLIVRSDVYVSYVPPESAIRLRGEMNQVKISRPEHVRWAVQVEGFPPPKFWDGNKPGFRFDYAVAKYCEYWKERGRDPGDLDTEAPTFDDDVEAMKAMFPEGVPEKTLQAIRKKVWGSSRIKRGRPRKFR